MSKQVVVRTANNPKLHKKGARESRGLDALLVERPRHPVRASRSCTRQVLSLGSAMFREMRAHRLAVLRNFPNGLLTPFCSLAVGAKPTQDAQPAVVAKAVAIVDCPGERDDRPRVCTLPVVQIRRQRRLPHAVAVCRSGQRLRPHDSGRAPSRRRRHLAGDVPVPVGRSALRRQSAAKRTLRGDPVGVLHRLRCSLHRSASRS